MPIRSTIHLARKADTLDSEWIAELALNNLIDPSRILPKDDRDLRMLTRTRESLVKIRSQIKNRVHQEQESCSIKLSSVLSDSFGKSGRYILDGLIKGLCFEEIVAGLPSKKGRNKRDQIRDVIKSGLDQLQVFLIGSHLDTIDNITQHIAEIDLKIEQSIVRRKDDLETAMSMPGIGFTAASTILAEIGNYNDFSTPDKLAA
jgi:transposase